MSIREALERSKRKNIYIEKFFEDNKILFDVSRFCKDIEQEIDLNKYILVNNYRYCKYKREIYEQDPLYIYDNNVIYDTVGVSYDFFSDKLHDTMVNLLNKLIEKEDLFFCRKGNEVLVLKVEKYPNKYDLRFELSIVQKEELIKMDKRFGDYKILVDSDVNFDNEQFLDDEEEVLDEEQCLDDEYIDEYFMADDDSVINEGQTERILQIIDKDFILSHPFSFWNHYFTKSQNVTYDLNVKLFPQLGLFEYYMEYHFKREIDYVYINNVYLLPKRYISNLELFFPWIKPDCYRIYQVGQYGVFYTNSIEFRKVRKKDNIFNEIILSDSDLKTCYDGKSQPFVKLLELLVRLKEF